MRKLAVFVEGQTEALFFRRLLDIAAEGFSLKTQTTRQTVRIETVNLFRGENELTHFVSINDCGNDDQVVSAIRDGYKNLAAAAVGVKVFL